MLNFDGVSWKKTLSERVTMVHYVMCAEKHGQQQVRSPLTEYQIFEDIFKGRHDDKMAELVILF